MARNTDELSKQILRHVSSKQYKPVKLRKLAVNVGVDEGDFGVFREAVKDLMRAGRVVLGGGNQVMLPEAGGAIIGRFRGHERGFGFVVPESPVEHGDLFIPPGASLNAITGDIVSARITRRGKTDDSRVEGEIVEIVQRGQNRFVGELMRRGRDWVVVPDGNTLHKPILVGDVSSTRAKSGDQVVVELTQFPSTYIDARGVIVEVLGRRGETGIDTISIIRQYNFPTGFPEATLEDARNVIHQHSLEEALSQREDLRSETIVTIDPDDARDFDDAISLRPAAAGGFELGVHIADVSHFVRPDAPLDREAAHRGNSIYLPQHVIPMLPEVLSNGLCSLQENEPRLCKSAFITYDRTGRRTSARFANTVIQSSKRLTYRQAGKILEGETAEYTAPVIKLLQQMDRLARIIRKRRLADGMIVLDIPDVELVIDDEGRVTGVEPADTGFPHTIIEMFMVEANEAVADLMTRLNVPHLRRIHPDPPPDSRTKLARFLGVLGKKLPDKAERQDIIHLLESVKGRPESFAVNLAALRSMSPAEYSPRRVGHYALASKAYSHFTSPIRRYPDLVIHRLLDEYLATGLKSRKHREAIPSEATLQTVGKTCTYTEKRAEDAERELRMVKTLQFLAGHLGDIEDGVVTGVTNVGIFVQLRKYLVDGLVRFEDMADDWWDLDPRGGCVVGQRSGRRIKIGDPLRVQIAAVDLAARKLNLALADRSTEPAADATKTPAPRGRRAEAPRPAGPQTAPPARGRRGPPRPASRAPGRKGRGRRGR